MLLEVAHLESGTWGPKLQPGACPSDESGVDDNGKGSLGDPSSVSCAAGSQKKRNC